MLKLEPDFQQKNQLQFWQCVINPRKAGWGQGSADFHINFPVLQNPQIQDQAVQS